MANEIHFRLDASLTPGYKGKSHTRCLRGRDGHEYWNQHIVQLVPPTERWQDAHVYVVHLTDEQRERWPCQPQIYWVVAMAERGVASYLAHRYGEIARRHEGMARAALGRLSHKISTAGREERAAPHAQTVADRETFVVERVQGDRYILDVRDNISFAQLAVRGGAIGVQIAMKKAANKIAGLIQHTCRKILLPGELPTPFPEVRRRRSA